MLKDQFENEVTFRIGTLMTLTNDPDRDWQRWGTANPYFAVLTEARFLNENLNTDTLRDFFTTGDRHVEHVYDVVRASIRSDFQPARVLDYGCGVGRLLVPLARRAQSVIGVDVSSRMLELARQNCDQFNISSVRLLNVQELDSLEPASLDFVHSFIVFQHIPVGRGESIVRKLIGLLADRGVGAIHLTFVDKRSFARRAVLRLRTKLSLVHGLFNLAQGRPFTRPLMQMNSYSINRIFDLLIDAQCSNVHVEFSDHGGFRGAMFYFEKSAKPLL